MAGTRRRLFGGLAILTAVLVMGGLGEKAEATLAVDQAQYNGLHAFVAWSGPLGQTFTPTEDNLAGFKFWFTYSTGGTTFDFRVIHWADQVEVAQVTYLNTVAGGQNYVALPNVISLIPGDKYGIVEYGSPWPFFQADLFGTVNPYSGGSPVVGGVEQTETGGSVGINDLWFQTFYDTDYAPPIPEPMTLFSAFMAMSGLGMYIRRRVRGLKAE